MSEAASVLWPLVTFGMAAGAGKCVAIWLGIRAQTAIRLEQRDERERGLSPRIEAVEKALADMKNEQRTFMANARSQR